MRAVVAVVCNTVFTKSKFLPNPILGSVGGVEIEQVIVNGGHLGRRMYVN
jgi:hypothetical protein